MWRFRKTKQLGPVKVSITRRGLGFSLGVGHLPIRVGTTAAGKKYVTLRLPGTGISYTHFIGGKD